MEKAIPLSNIISAAADGAPAMFGCDRGFISHLKQNVSRVFAIHCIIHQQHLVPVAKNLSARLHQSQFVINTVNRICINVLKSWLFTQFEENDEDFHQLLLHTEICWLSKSLCLTRFFPVFEMVLELLDAKDPILKENLIKWKPGIAYLTDLFTKFNEV
ncbi:hypothetical protein JRQ81_016207 [Phrynocephalus forsythii]|uniref:SCAN domain-containing protein 3 n=1 Tax=Phrynocephalus forsythii TaxID=171643 RepID=A0A9Q1B2T2_9SAUR|nr:hypothetical protein JRQ81_016207 [Phrynocephalus forsythii]